MRNVLIAAATVAAMAAVPADAQTYRHGRTVGGAQSGGGWSGGGAGAGGWSGGARAGQAGGWSGQRWSGGGRAGQGWNGQRGNGQRWNNQGASSQGWNGQQWGGGRWGGQIGGRWYGGARAPGGWAAYRRPMRGWAMPGYWRSPAWAINDWGFYGLQAPPAGFGWSRYYDDAVLLDDRGYVYDSVGGLDWQRADQPYATGYGYPGQGYYNAPGEYHGSDPRCVRKRKGSGIGGAILGGAVGVAIGAATGGTGAMLLGGGLGALGGQAIDRDSQRGVVCDDGPGPDYGRDAPYIEPEPVLGYAPPPPPHVTVEYSVPVTTTTTTTTVTEEWIYPRIGRKAVRKGKPRSKLVRCSC